MIRTVDKDSCDGCGVCVENCPVLILHVESGKVTITTPEMCTDCGICREVCPNQALIGD